jgi:hypothetical protein
VPKAESLGFKGFQAFVRKYRPLNCWPASSVARRLLLVEQSPPSRCFSSST